MRRNTMILVGAVSLFVLAACGGGHSDEHDHDHDHGHGEAPVELTASVEGSQLTLLLEAPVSKFGADENETSSATIDAQIADTLNVEGANNNDALASYFVLPAEADCALTGANRTVREGEATSVALSLDYSCGAVDKLDQMEVRLFSIEAFDHIDTMALRGDGQREKHMEGDDPFMRLD